MGESIRKQPKPPKGSMPKTGGRPKAKVDEATLEQLCKRFVSDKTISIIMGISEATLHRRFADKMAIWRQQTVAKTLECLVDEGIHKRKQWALEKLLEKHCGYEKVSRFEHTGKGGMPLESNTTAVIILPEKDE